MCGIAGSIKRVGPASDHTIRSQLRVLDHRGPDSVGAFVRGNCAIGQTRLAVLDLVSGDPPVTDENDAIGVALNGEVYNYVSLREELQRVGHRLRTTGDTEVIAHLAESLEPCRLAARLDGMFAFAVWDSTRERLIIGRDRIGKKPLYYWSGPQEFVFGSEIKAVLAHPAVTANLDSQAIPAYLGFGYVPSPHTFFEGIRSVPPGHVLVVDRDLRVQLECYWQPELPGIGGVTALDLTLHEAAGEVRKRLADAVRARLVADVPLGAFLSGGIDSSAVVSLMASESSRPVRTFTIGFADNGDFDERRWAQIVANRFGTDHTEFIVSPQAVDLVERLVWHHDAPFGDSSAIPTFLLSQLTREHVTVALCGDGGDELFAGYERFAAGVAVDLLRHLPSPILRRLAQFAKSIPARLPPTRARKAQRFLVAASQGLPDAYREWVSYIPDEMVSSLVSSPPRRALDDYARVWSGSAGAQTLDRLLLLNLRTYLLDDLLPKVDRTAMAHALEVRSPFLDHHLVDFAFRLPPSTKLRGLSLKRVLKVAMSDLLPDEILHRAKHGFGVPLDRWFREDLTTYVDAKLGSGARLRTHLDSDTIDRVLAEHRRGAQHGQVLWTLLTLEIFLRQRAW